nr:MAG TPA: hypothetical protein [Caudoviricetes sp.]DAS26218.1 MAG TPA: hypothetical protein [Caudoviricetes sp.]
MQQNEQGEQGISSIFLRKEVSECQRYSYMEDLRKCIMSKYIIQESSIHPNGWVLTDTENKVSIKFDDGLFNETRETILLEGSSATDKELAHIVDQMESWVTRHHGSKCFRKTYGYEVSEDDTKGYLYRRKAPRWRLEIQEPKVTAETLATSLRKAAEFLIKRNRYE